MIKNAVAESIIKRDRTIVAIGLTAIIVVAANLLLGMTQEYDTAVRLLLSVIINGDESSFIATVKGGSEVLKHTTHGESGFLTLFWMWVVMQVAMMSPTAVPMILMHTKVERHRKPENSPIFVTILFFLGYIIVWVVFSAIFAGVQQGLQSRMLLSPQMTSTSPWLAGGILIAAGLFQFSKLKAVCLNQCRSPVTYFMLEWREGNAGAILMGLKHGVHCVGCCWVLMALLFVAGVMNLLWMAVITGFMLIEKLMPRGDLFGRIGGAGMIAWGIYFVTMAQLN